MTPTDQQLRIAVAEAMGWKACQVAVRPLTGIRDPIGIPPDRNGGFRQPLPNYPASLDACAEFEATMNDAQCYQYTGEIAKLKCRQFENGVPEGSKAAEGFGWHATARQRCLAYLATVAPAKLKEIST